MLIVTQFMGNTSNILVETLQYNVSTENGNTTLRYFKRRKQLLQAIPSDSLVIIPNNSFYIRSNDVEYKFKVDNDFYYLTGFEEPNAICLLVKEKNAFSYFLFIDERKKEKEIWTGKRVSKEQIKKNYKPDQIFYLSEFFDMLKKLIQGKDHIYYPLGKNKDFDQKIINLREELRSRNRIGIKSPKSISCPREIIHRMRLIKDEFEISLIQKAISISQKAHIEALKKTRPGLYEYELEALIEYEFRSHGSTGPAYPSIVGSGKNTCVLHYTKNNKKIKNGELVLIDAGSEFNNYASDITRTFPANKKFTPIQKDIYEIVLEAQAKAIEQIKPGKKFLDSYNKAVLIIVEGLKELKLLKGSTEQIIRKKTYKKFFMHRLGHWLGLDVHDVGPYVDENGKSIKLKPGMIMTAEPGIYIGTDLEDVPERFKGIGIRIEDDVLVTKNGCKVLTKDLPKSIKEIESFK